MRELTLSDLQRLYYQAYADRGRTIILATASDISSGVAAALPPFRRWTLYLRVTNPVSIILQLSPDDGLTFFTPEESPIVFSSPGDKLVEMGYDASYIRLTANPGTLVTAFIRGVV